MNDELIQPLVDSLRNRTPLALLAPKRIWDEALDQRIASLSIGELAGQQEAKPYAMLVQSGLHLWNESLDRSHSISQSVHNRTGSYWHGIMHRMEGDYWNAKYWFHQVGDHPAYGEVYEQVVRLRDGGNLDSDAASLIQSIVDKGTWDPYFMIDLVESELASNRSEVISLLEKIQHIELSVLLDYTYRKCRERSNH